jgi:hypothetical protein
MTQPIPRDAIYRRRFFDAEVIELCVRWYISYRLSYRDLVEMMAERGVQVAHTTILRWVIRYVPEYETTMESLLETGRNLLACGRDLRVQFEAAGNISTVPSTSMEKRSTSYCAVTAESRRHKRSFAKRSPP